jgi:hypothetical protein
MTKQREKREGWEGTAGEQEKKKKERESETRKESDVSGG